MRYAFRAVVFAFVAALPVFGQISGRISGTVVDPTGASVPAAEVELLLPGGQKPLLATKTADDGQFNLIGVRPARYDVVITAKGFVKTTLHDVAVDPARETSMPTVKLQTAAVTFSVDVTSGADAVSTSNSEVTQTITTDQVKNLPLLDRDVLGLIQTQPGVVYNGNSNTVINGLRTSYSNMTLDGVNIQDNYIRDNALDYSPNKPHLGQVREMTLVTANQNSAGFGGATQFAMSSPSGTNEFHGEVLWYNRNNQFSANDWFNNQAGAPLPFLNQNQFGGNVGGPIRKDKLFFYADYEGLRNHSQTGVNTTILTAAARQGIFTYQSGSTLVQKNLLALRNTQIDSVMAGILAQVPDASHINNTETGDGRNTAGYRFNQRNNETQDNVNWHLDYNISVKNALSGTYAWNRQNTDRPDAENDYSLIPKATNPNHAHFLALSWRTTPTASLTNELHGGFNRTAGDFLTSQQFGGGIVTGTIFSDPVNEFQPQGRTTNTYNFADDAAWQKGRHFFQFGFQGQQVRVDSYDAAGVVPTFTLGMGAGQPALSRRDLPGISSTDLDTANSLLATLGGYIDSYSQTFNVASRTSGFVGGQRYERNFILNEYAFYFQDKWKLLPRLTLTLGLRWQLPGVADETDGLEVAPVVQGSAVQTLLSNATIDFTGGSTGRRWYRRDFKEFAPNFGFAWDVFGNGRTAVRGGYSINWVNDQAILAPETMLETNYGLQQAVGDVGLNNRVATGLPVITAPVFQVPRTIQDNYNLDPFNATGMIDPNLRRPYVQQYTFGIQQQVGNTVFEARYVGNHMVGGFRAFDFNQVVLRQNGFLADFLRARNNGFLAQEQSGTFNPAYNSSIPGSQQLTVFPKLLRGGSFSDANVTGYLQTGEPGALAYYYATNGLNGSVNFFQNPYTLGADMLTNYSSSSYNALQLQARRRLTQGLSLDVNYTFSKVLSDSDGDVQSRIEHFLDINNPGIERARANFDLTHMFKANVAYDLPFGKGKRLHHHLLDPVIGGWNLASSMVWQSGAPFSILSGRGTNNRVSR
ncbi:MAG: TonB-dependent receptor, partial [Acidobacteria bacterium]|nr:TonB-dependent receptor [Acidobacteriota bacterium]